MAAAQARDDYLLALDNGTQSVRALVFDRRGELLAKSKIDVEPYLSPRPGWAELEPEYCWRMLCLACEQLWPQLAFPREHIKAVALTTQRATVLNLDADGRPLRRAIAWLDQRRAERFTSLGWIDAALSCVGLKGRLDALRREAESNWIAQHQPEIAAATRHQVFLSGYYAFRLTGNLRDAVAAQVGYVPFDYKKQRWLESGSWRYRAFAQTRDQMPDLVAAGGELGRISPAAARATGIPAGVPLIAAGSDKACEVLGSGCIDVHMGAISYGTTATFNVCSAKYFEVDLLQPAYPAVVPGLFNIETMVHRGYWMVNWFKKELGLREVTLARKQGRPAEELFDDLLRAVPPGAMGLVLQPYWSSGANSAGPEAKGAIIGFGDLHTRAHIYRAIVEGIAYALREGKERLEKRGGITLKTLRVSGGGSQSDKIVQMTADIFGLPVQRPHTYETSGLGAAIAAAVGIGLYPSFTEAVARMVRCGQCFHPNPGHHQLYEQLFRKVYRRLYGQLRPSYRAIRNITGYPG